MHFMREALRLGASNPHATAPNPSVGCVIVKDGAVIGWGATLPPGQAHAERVALERCTEDPAGAVVYVTLEPCTFEGRTGACALALQRARVGRVVYALSDPNPRMAAPAAAVLDAAGIRVEGGLLAESAEQLHADFLFRQRRGRPRVSAPIAPAPPTVAAGERDLPAQVAAQRAWAGAGALVTSADRVLADPARYTTPVIAGAAAERRLIVLGPREANLRAARTLAARALSEAALSAPAKVAQGSGPTFTTIDLDIGADLRAGLLEGLLSGLDVNTVALDGCARVLDLFARHDLLDALTLDVPTVFAVAPGAVPAGFAPPPEAELRVAASMGPGGDTLRIEYSRQPGKTSDAWTH